MFLLLEMFSTLKYLLKIFYFISLQLVLWGVAAAERHPMHQTWHRLYVLFFEVRGYILTNQKLLAGFNPYSSLFIRKDPQMCLCKNIISANKASLTSDYCLYDFNGH